MVRELSSDGQSKADPKAGTTARSGEAAAEAQSQPKTPVTENAVNASKIAVQRNPEANSEQIEELIEDDPKLEKQDLAAQGDQEQAAGDMADGDEQNGLLQAKSIATPVAAEEDDELIAEDEEGLSEEYELDAAAELPGTMTTRAARQTLRLLRKIRKQVSFRRRTQLQRPMIGSELTLRPTLNLNQQRSRLMAKQRSAQWSASRLSNLRNRRREPKTPCEPACRESTRQPRQPMLMVSQQQQLSTRKRRCRQAKSAGLRRQSIPRWSRRPV